MTGDVMKKTLAGYIGIDTLTEQIRKKSMRQGFEFNIMVVGGSGLGKSTLVNTIFRSSVSRRAPEDDYQIPHTVEIKTISHVIEEKGIRLKLTITDTPGFGDQVNNSKCWQPITNYITDQYEKYLNEEISIKRRKRIPDNRVHCCIYFIPPTGHSLRPVDIEVLKKLVEIANVIPVIAKSDSLTMEERNEFKERIRKDLEENNINVYPDVANHDVDEEEMAANEPLMKMMPFAVVGSTSSHQVGNKNVLGRKTRWGVVEVENDHHCDFIHLRNMIIRTHLQDLKEATAQVYYELYRHKRLEAVKEVPLDSVPASPSPVGMSYKNGVKAAEAKSSQDPKSTPPLPKKRTPQKNTKTSPSSAKPIAESNI